MIDLWGSEWHDEFYADTERNFSDCYCSRSALAAFNGDNGALKGLDALFSTFFNLAINLDDITDLKFRRLSDFALFLIECDEFLVHMLTTFAPPNRNQEGTRQNKDNRKGKRKNLFLAHVLEQAF